jgi:hypothetical protein
MSRVFTVGNNSTTYLYLVLFLPNNSRRRVVAYTSFGRSRTARTIQRSYFTEKSRSSVLWPRLRANAAASQIRSKRDRNHTGSWCQRLVRRRAIEYRNLRPQKGLQAARWKLTVHTAQRKGGAGKFQTACSDAERVCIAIECRAPRERGLRQAYEFADHSGFGIIGICRTTIPSGVPRISLTRLAPRLRMLDLTASGKASMPA